MKNKTNITEATKLMAPLGLAFSNGFPQLLKGIRDTCIGIPFTVPTAVGNNTWSKLDNSERITLSKMFSNNVHYGNINGIELVNTPKGKAQRYVKKLDKIMVKNIFWMIDKGNIKNEGQFKEILSQDDKLIVVCNYNFTDTKHEAIQTTVYGTLNGRKVFEKTKKVNLGLANLTQICALNKEFPSIYSVWFGFESVWSNMEKILYSKLSENKEKKSSKQEDIVFIAPNPQMVSRLIGIKCDEYNTKYDYVEFIQENFKLFLKGGLMAIPYTYGIHSIEKRNLDTWIKK